MPQLHVLVGSAAHGALPGGLAPDGTLLLDLGPDHPSRAGLLELDLWTDAAGELVEQADVTVGAMHRGVEKLFEVRDYRQVLMLADRHDWQAPFAGELTVAVACEELLGMTVPPRAVWLRTLLAEHTRIASHLGFLGYLTHRSSDPGDRRVSRLREQFREQLRRLTGNRVHPMVTRIGGLATDADEAWLDGETDLATRAGLLAADLAALLDAEFDAAGVAPLGDGTARAYGVTGPAARAAGADVDLRRLTPYLAYGDLSVPATARTAGDAQARFAAMVDEVATSADLVSRCADRLRTLDGPVAQPLPKILKLPDDEGYLATEAPLGQAGAHVVSRGDKTPWRLHLRTPSFATVSALPAVLPGVRVEDLELALASLGYVVGDVDR